MSNGRRHRRVTAAAKLRALTANAPEPEVVIFGSGKGDGTLVMPITRGKALFLVLVPPAGASGELLLAYSARATASISGECPACGATRHSSNGAHKRDRLVVEHEDWCSASDAGLLALRRAERDG